MSLLLSDEQAETFIKRFSIFTIIMSGLENKLVEKFVEVLNALSARKGRIDSEIRNRNLDSAENAARFFLESVDIKQTSDNKHLAYLNCPELIMPGAGYSGIRISNLFNI